MSREDPSPIPSVSEQKRSYLADTISHQIGSISRSEAFALIWIACFPLLVYYDGAIVTCLGLYPSLSWDTALKYYYFGISSIEVIIIFLYGLVFARKEKDHKIEAHEVQPSEQLD